MEISMQMAIEYAKAARTHELQGQYIESLAMYERALTALQDRYRRPHSDIAAVYQRMVYSHFMLYGQAVTSSHYLEAKRIRIALYGMKKLSSRKAANNYLCKALRSSTKVLQRRLAWLEQAIDQGALIDFTNSEDPSDFHSKTPLGIAVDEDNPELCKFLLLYGAAANGIDEDYRPLIDAAENGLYEICELLLQHGADVNAPDHRSLALTAAIYSSHPRSLDICILLVKYGADLNAFDEEGDSALKIAITGGTIYSRRKTLWLLAQGACLYDIDSKGSSALSLAEAKGNVQLYEDLQQMFGAKRTTPNSSLIFSTQTTQHSSQIQAEANETPTPPFKRQRLQ